MCTFWVISLLSGQMVTISRSPVSNTKMDSYGQDTNSAEGTQGFTKVRAKNTPSINTGENGEDTES